MNVRTKFEVRSFTHSRDNRGYLKLWAVPVYDYAPFNELFDRMDPVNEATNVRILHVPQIIAIEVLGGVANPRILGKRRP